MVDSPQIEQKDNIKYDIMVKESNGSWKSIGYYYKRQFRKIIRGSKHIYRKTNSLGIDAEMFNKVIRFETDVIQIFDKESRILYVVRTSMFDHMKTYLHHKPHRAQVFLPIKHFKKIQK